MNFIADTQAQALSRAARRSSTRTALLLAVAGFGLLSVGDALVKSMSGEWPATAVAALRYTVGALGLTLIVAIRYGRSGFSVPQPLLQLGRGAAVSLATVCFFIAAMQMPLADATAVQFISPLLTALLAALLLRERPGPAVWIGIALASAGVLLVLRPNVLAFGATAFLPLGTALGMAILIILNRSGAGSAPAIVMQFLFAATAAPLLIAAAVLFAWADPARFAIGIPSAAVVAKCGAIAVTGTLGHWLIYRATERAGAGTVAPMGYAQLIVAALLGWAWFGDAPHQFGIAGALLIVSAGLLVWRAAPKDAPKLRLGLRSRDNPSGPSLSTRTNE